MVFVLHFFRDEAVDLEDFEDSECHGGVDVNGRRERERVALASRHGHEEIGLDRNPERRKGPGRGAEVSEAHSAPSM
jgi:hypothetical protein